MAGYPTVEQSVSPGDDAARDRKNVHIGPFLATQYNANATIKTGTGVLGTVTISNSDASAKTVNFYDAVSATNPIDQAIVPANSSLNLQIHAEFFTALRVEAAAWTNLLVSVRWR